MLFYIFILTIKNGLAFEYSSFKTWFVILLPAPDLPPSGAHKLHWTLTLSLLGPENWWKILHLLLRLCPLSHAVSHVAHVDLLDGPLGLAQVSFHVFSLHYIPKFTHYSITFH